MIDDLTILAIFLAAVVCVVGLRLTKPVPVRVPVIVTDPEPRQVVSVVRPMALATPEPVVAYTDETIQFPEGMLAFLQSLPDIGPGVK